MAKRIVAKTGEYTNQQGEQKANWTEIGVILSNQHGEYIMLNPTVDLAGVLMKQRVLAQKTGKTSGDNVMCSIFDNSNQGSQSAPPQQPPSQGNAGGGFDDFDDDIPFNKIGAEVF